MSYLKIKDNIDLKELEKFGFKKTFFPFEYMGICCDYYKIISNSTTLFIKNKEILKKKFKRYGYRDCFNYEWIEQKINKRYIQDLIKADLINKVEE